MIAIDDLGEIVVPPNRHGVPFTSSEKIIVENIQLFRLYLIDSIYTMDCLDLLEDHRCSTMNQISEESRNDHRFDNNIRMSNPTKWKDDEVKECEIKCRYRCIECISIKINRK